MSKRLQTSFSQRSSAKGRITRIANRFMAIGGETDARESVITLRNDMNAALQKFVEIDEQFIRELNAEEESEHPITSRTAAEYVADADEYLIKAEEMLFEASRYMDRQSHWALWVRLGVADTRCEEGRRYMACLRWFSPSKHDYGMGSVPSSTNNWRVATHSARSTYVRRFSKSALMRRHNWKQP